MVDPLERTVDALRANLTTAQRELGRYRDENLELENRLESADRELDRLRTLNAQLMGAVDGALTFLNRATWTPRRSGAEAE